MQRPKYPRKTKTQAYRTKKVRKLVKKHGNKCFLCGNFLDAEIKNCRDPMYITFEHMVPKSAGGSNLLENIRLSHQRCNNVRSSRPLSELKKVHQ